jgi:ankyrin repeat protein
MRRNLITGRSDYARLLSSESSEMLDDALAHGFAIDTIEDRGETLLMEAVARGSLDWAKTLLSKGADPNPNIPNPMGNTAVLLAILDARFEFLEPLVEAGANLDVINTYKQGVFASAMEIFPQSQEQGETNRLQRKMLVKLLELGANPNTAFGEKDTTLLIELCYRGLTEELVLLDLLEEKGVDINKPNVAGIVPLHLAVRNEPFAYARWLLEKGANMDAVSLDGTSVEQLCATVFKDEFDAFRHRKSLAQATPIVSRSHSKRL